MDTPPAPGLARHGARWRGIVALSRGDAERVATLAVAEGVTVTEWLTRAVQRELDRQRARPR